MIRWLKRARDWMGEYGTADRPKWTRQDRINHDFNTMCYGDFVDKWVNRKHG